MISKNYFEKCIVCDSFHIKNQDTYKKHFLCQCSDCGFVFARKIPTLTELEEHYNGYGRNDFLSPITIKRYNEILDSFEPFRNNGRLLDVGCGIGYFLEVAKTRGWEVYGTEFTDEAVEICSKKGIIINKGVLNVENYKPDFFDIITSFEVIEHINNPREELNNFNILLRKGGLVYITTPNFNSLLRYRLKSYYNVIVYPEHLSYYTPKTLTKVFHLSGFKKIKVQATGISLTRLRTSKGTSDQAYISGNSDDEKLRNKFESNKLLALVKGTINSFLSFFGVGDSLKGYFVKS
jgi:2-polyprenyl-3-methyl-5-hydroxy-6-metoxy-1,4-benzoquinol methylase